MSNSNNENFEIENDLNSNSELESNEENIENDLESNELESNEENIENDLSNIETDWNEEFSVNKKNFINKNSKFKFHAEIEDPDFYKKLFSKKEFHKHQYKIETKKMEDICPQTS